MVAVLRSAAHLSLGEFFGMYPPKLYFIAWIPRTLFQLGFFALLAQFLGGPAFLSFVVIGTVAHAAYIGALLFTISSVGREQDAGTVPLLVASPSNPVPVFVGRSAALLGNGLVTSALTLALATVVLDVELTWTQLGVSLAILLLMTASICSLGLLLGSIALRIPEYRNTVSNASGIVLTFLTGVYVPVVWLPEWVQPISEVLPVTHGLRALRQVTVGTPADLAGALATEALIGVMSLGLAFISFSFFLRQARAAGTLDFH